MAESASEDDTKRKFREALERKREQAKRLHESVERDEGNVARWEATMSTLGSGARADEMRYSLTLKITDVQDRLRAKRQRLDELNKDIREMAGRG